MKKSNRCLPFALLLAIALPMEASWADGTRQSLPFSQNWSNTAALLTTSKTTAGFDATIWASVPGFEGLAGPGQSGMKLSAPTAGNSAPNTNLSANSTVANTAGGAHEIPDDAIGLRASSNTTAGAPSLVLHLDTSSSSSVQVAYLARVLQVPTANAQQLLQLQWRVPGALPDTSSTWQDLGSAVTIAATTVAGDTIPVTVDATAIAGQPLVQLRWFLVRGNSGSSRMIGVDDISVTAGAPPSTPSVSLSVAPDSFSELGGSAMLTATLSAVSTQDVTVNFVFSGTATNGTVSSGPDYSASAASLTIPAGTSGGSITLSANDDVDFEGDETIVTMLGSLANTVAGTPNSVTATILENETAPPPMVGARIYEIQGVTHRSLMVSQAVTVVPGIVTAVAGNGFYMQDGDGDGNAATSDGIFVFTNSAPAGTIVVGAQVLVSGVVDEFRPGGSATNLTVTEIISPTVTLFAGTGLFTNTVIAPTVLGTGGRIPPADIIDNDTAGNVETSLTTLFDPAQDGIDFHESLEGMLVQVNNGRATSPTNGFGEIWVVGDDGANASGGNARGGVTLVERASGIDFNPERIQLDDGLNGVVSPSVNVGDTLTNIRGVVHYNFGNFEVLLTQAPTVTANPLTPSVHTLDFGGDRLTVGAYNVENLDPGDTTFARLAGQIVNNIGAPDILALSEVQDNNGATNNGVVAANTTINQLIAAIGTAGGPTYSFTQIDPVNNMDGGEPGGNIRVVQLYNATRVNFVPGTTGAGGSTDATAPAQVDGKVALTLSPGRIAPTNSAWNSSRKPLAVTYDFNGRRVVIVNNHFNSKGGDQPLFGVNQPPLLNSEAQRRNQATLVHGFVNSVLALDADARVVVLGDLNDFDFSPPLRILRNGPLGLNGEEGALPALVNLGTERVTDPAERYSYVFEGNSQELDHILSTTRLRNAGAQYEALHINAEYADQASDHDALLSSFLLPANGVPTADAGLDRTVASGDPVTLDGSGSTDDDGIDGYAWTQTGGTTVTLTDANTSMPSFAAPATPGTLSFTLTVTDDEGATDTDSVDISVARDITPTPFSFIAVSDVAPNSLQFSESITVTGINDAAPVSVVGGFFDVNMGPCTQTSGTVVSNDTVRICHNASPNFATQTGTTLTIGADGILTGVYASFSSTTRAAPPPESPALEFRMASGTVLESVGTHAIELLLDRPAANPVGVTIRYAGSARFGVDYTAPTALMIPAGVSRFSFDITVINDTRDEPARTVFMVLGTPTGATLGNPSSRQLTIFDNDPTPTLSFPNASTNVNENRGTQNVRLLLSAASDQTIIVPLTYGGSARRNSDFRGPGSVTINPGNREVNIPIQIINDSIGEAQETIVIDLGNPQNASRGSRTRHTLRIAKSD